jgi:hypothetical protein
MAGRKQKTLNARGYQITLLNRTNQDDYFSLTDIAKYKSNAPDDVIKNWMRNLDTIEFLGLWETLNNPNFKPVEFDGFRREAGHNAFVLSPKKWADSTGAIGIHSKAGRHGGTFAHVDIAMEFASWVSPEFKLYIIRDYQRIKLEEKQRLSLEWSLQRTLAKINYRIHTDAIKEQIIPPEIAKSKANSIYASEADLLNVALFGKTAAEWRDAHPEAKGNIRDEATLEQLIVLSNLESINALLIRQNLPQNERIILLNQAAIAQLTSLVKNEHIKRLGDRGRLNEKDTYRSSQ